MGKTHTRILWLFALLLCAALLAAALVSCGETPPEKPAVTDTEAVTDKPAETEPATEPETVPETTETLPAPHSIDDDETEPETRAEEVLYNVIPDCDWGHATEDDPVSFTFGNTVYAQRFDPVDLTKYQYIEFDFYIPDITVFEEGSWTANSQFEITSGGREDSEEFCWGAHTFFDGMTLEEGWNHIQKGFGDLSGTVRERINFIRWYFVPAPGEKSISGCKLANLRFTAKGSIEPEE